MRGWPRSVLVVVGAVLLGAAAWPAKLHGARAEELNLLRKKVKYVFVLFQENRSFDFYFGTFPGADGLFSRRPAETAGFTQPIVESDGTLGSISPFLIPGSVTDGQGRNVPLYPADTASVDHSHRGIDNALHVVDGIARNDRYALNEEGLTTEGDRIVLLETRQPLPADYRPSLVRKQMAELVMSHVDCDTVPFLWQYAARFTLFDNFHQTTIGPSTPNAIAMIAGQSGETQWVLHPEQASNGTGEDILRSGGVPLVADPGPWPGSNLDHAAVKPPYGLHDESPATPALNQTYASLPLSFMGAKIHDTVSFDQHPALDLGDVAADIDAIAAHRGAPIEWGWYQQGYDREPTDHGTEPPGANYIVHHAGPQYFGYVGDNSREVAHLHGLEDFFEDVAAHRLGPRGGVYYVRGGYGNNDGLLPLDPNPAVRQTFPGNDDHPGYADAQISEALLADEINAIAASPYWGESVIIIAYDETDGLYDHALPRIRSTDPDGDPLAGGPRIPAVLISPFARTHHIVHDYAEHSSVIRFIERWRNLTPLANLPDERRARERGRATLGQRELGPADALPGMTDLMAAFDPARLQGKAAPLPASLAEIDPAEVHRLPHYGGRGCARLGLVPTDYRHGAPIDPAPPDFNPRPATTPGIPTGGDWQP